ncbi:MAG: response regulator [Anaerolineae bacterium]|nr:response regulator [Anaerolineae bacterium]
MNNQMDTPQANILVVDDTLANLRLLVKMLAEYGYKIRPATNGRLALAAALAEPPDLILLDIMMPEIDGYEVCGRLKADERTRDIPIIFISAIDELLDKVAAFSIGGVDYITKPFQVEEVLARVKTHLTIRNLQKKLEQKNQQLQEKNNELEAALARVKLLSGLLPICSNCKKIRNDEGYWQQVEEYIHQHSEADFSHGLCPACLKELYPDLYQKMEERRQDILSALARLNQANLANLAAAVNLPESNTLARLQMMIEEKQVEQVQKAGQIFYRLPAKGHESIS